MAFLEPVECPVSKRNHIKHIIVKLLKTRAEQKILNVAREKNTRYVQMNNTVSDG